MQDRSASLLILLWLAVIISAGLLLDRPPAPVPASAPLSEFSAERALTYLNDFAQKPHPIGTPEHDRVRDYLVEQIKILGLAPEIQRTTGVTPIYQVSGRVENIIARLKGTGSRPDAVMVAAHYDSVPAGPGAGDDGAGVAALLETIRALRAGPPPKNDIIFLLTDGEEEGMLGASAFVDEHPWARDVRIAANFEGRGNAGDSQLFETSAGNSRLVQVLSEAVPHAAGSSFTYEVYKHMPNDTDMTVFKKSGAAGLNFAFIGHWEAYHTPLDTPQALDAGSLQRHGDYALGLARKLGDADLGQLQAPADSVYFSTPGGLFLHYPSASIWPLVSLAAVAFLASWLYASGAYQAGIGKTFIAILAHVGVLLLLMLTAFVFVKGVNRLHLTLLPAGDVVKSVPYVFSLIALLTGLATALLKLLSKKVTWPPLFLAAASLLLLLNTAAAKWLAGASYVLTWPLLAALLAAVFAAFNRQRTSPLPTIALSLLALPPLAIFVPLLRGFHEALGLTSFSPLLALTLGLLILAILPLLETLLKVSGRVFPASMLFAALLLFLLGASTTRYSNAHPQPDSLTYALDSDAHKALWASTSSRVDAWTTQYLSASPRRAKLTAFYPDWLPFQFLQHDAPALSLQPPQVDLLENSVQGDARSLRLRVTSPRHARVISVEVPNNEVINGWVNDHKLGQPEESRWNKHRKWEFDYANLPAEGIELRLQTKGAGPVKLAVVDRSIGLPAIPGTTFAPRPPDSMPQHSGDETMVRRTFVF